MTAKEKQLIQGIDADTLVLVAFKDGRYTEHSVAKWSEIYHDLMEDYAYAGEQPLKLKIAFLDNIEWKSLKVTQYLELV